MLTVKHHKFPYVVSKYYSYVLRPYFEQVDKKFVKSCFFQVDALARSRVEYTQRSDPKYVYRCIEVSLAESFSLDSTVYEEYESSIAKWFSGVIHLYECRRSISLDFTRTYVCSAVGYAGSLRLCLGCHFSVLC